MSARNIALFGIIAIALSGCISTETNPIETSPDDAAKANLQLGVAYLQRNELKLAREKLEKAVVQDPKLPSVRAYLGVLYERLGETEDADAQYRMAVKLAPKDPYVLNTYGGFLCRTGERRKGIEYLVKAAENPIYTTPEAAYVNAATCARGIPDLELTGVYLRKALRVDPYFRDALLQLAEHSLETGQALQARAFIQRFENAGPATAESLILGADAEAELGDAAAATAFIKRLEIEFPERAEELRQQRSGANDG